MKLIKTILVGLVIALSLLILFCGCESSKALDTDNNIDTSTPVTEDAEPEWEPDQADVEAIAKTLWGECRGVPHTSHKAAVVWCILNRVDKGGYFGSSIIEVISKPNQFLGYNPNHPVDPELEALARDVLKRWHSEKEGNENCGRVLPKDYYYFVGDGALNHFTNVWKSNNYWDWSLSNPYES